MILIGLDDLCASLDVYNGFHDVPIFFCFTFSSTWFLWIYRKVKLNLAKNAIVNLKGWESEEDIGGELGIGPLVDFVI